MRRTSEIIKAIRFRTESEDWEIDTTTLEPTKGISDATILEYLNDAQDHLQAEIISLYPDEFVAQEVIDIVPNQESYSISDNVFIDNRLLAVEYTTSGNERDYTALDQRTMKERRTDTDTHPNFYIRRSGQLLMNPIPTTTLGKLRISYYRELDNLDIRRGRISSVTGTGTSGDPITGIVLALGTISNNLTGLDVGDYVCINDKDGNVTAYNIPVTSYDSGTRTINVPSHVLGTGESISTSDYVTLGRYTTTNSDLPNNAERYFKVYGQMRVLAQDSSSDTLNETEELNRHLSSILKVFAQPDEDVHFVPILDDVIIW